MVEKSGKNVLFKNLFLIYFNLKTQTLLKPINQQKKKNLKRVQNTTSNQEKFFSLNLDLPFRVQKHFNRIPFMEWNSLTVRFIIIIFPRKRLKEQVSLFFTIFQ